MSELSQRVAERYVVAGLINAEDREGPTPPSVIRQTNRMFSDIRSGVIRHMRKLERGQSAERQALRRLFRSIRQYKRRDVSTLGDERDLQLHLLMTLNHLEDDPLNAKDLIDDAKTIDQWV